MYCCIHTGTYIIYIYIPTDGLRLRAVLFAPRMPRFRVHQCSIFGDQKNGHFSKCWKTQRLGHFLFALLRCRRCVFRRVQGYVGLIEPLKCWKTHVFCTVSRCVEIQAMCVFRCVQGYVGFVEPRSPHPHTPHQPPTPPPRSPLPHPPKSEA